MKIEIKCRFSGRVLFEHEAENNTVKLTLEAAIKSSANLARANLAGANLYGANLAGAYLYGANLDGANLDGTNLAGANLYGAYLYGTNLAGAYLAGANLDGTNLARANLDGANLAGAYLDGEKLTKSPLSLLNLKWSVLISGRFMRIGCQRHSHEDWEKFTDEKIRKMADGAYEFWREWKEPLLSLCRQYHEETEQEEQKEAA